MRVDIKPGATLKEVNEFFLIVARVVVYYAYRQNQIAVLTSGNDGNHGSRSYHPLGYGWDWRTTSLPYPKQFVKRVARTLKTISPYFDIVYETTKGNEHLHTEFDLRRAQKEGVKSQTEIRHKNLFTREKQMAEGATFKTIIALILRILKPVVKLISGLLRDEMTESLQKWYAKAKETENPWDDWFCELLAKILDIELPE